MARLNKTQTYAIYWLNNEGKSPEDISEELKLPLKQVVNCVEKAEINNNASKSLKNKSEPAKAKKKAKVNLVDEKRGVTVLTKGASELGDSIKSRPNINDKTVVHRLR